MLKRDVVYTEVLHDGTEPGITTTYCANGRFVHSYEDDSHKNLTGWWKIKDGQVLYKVRGQHSDYGEEWVLDTNSEFILHEIMAQTILEG